jgi:plastocyanin
VRPRLLLLLVLGAAAVTLAACSGEGSDAFVHVGMKDNFFTRDVTRIAVGDTVRWTNDGEAPHNALDPEGAWSTGEAAGKGEFDVMLPGEALEMTFPEEGIYEYYCSLHGTPDGEGMAAVLVVGDLEYQASEKAPAEPVTTWTGVTRNVPADYPTIQNAVDAAEPGDLVLVAPAPQDDEHLAPDGEYVYKEQVDVTTPYITIRGTDRDQVIIDGEFTRPNGINIAAADGVAVENMTARHATINGFFWTSLRGYRGSYLTAYNNGVYGIYAFDSTDGLLEHSYASGHPDGGFYIGQCDPCEAVIDHSISEWNGLGYSGTNSSGDIYLVRSVWRDNQAGIVPNSLDSELLPPVHDVTIVGNLIEGSGNAAAPALKAQFVAQGHGIILAGGLDSEVERNRIVNSTKTGVLITPNLDENFWMAGGNRIVDNVIEGSGYADIALGGPGKGGDCFADNTIRTTMPPGLETWQGCDGLRLPFRWELASTLMTLGRLAEANPLEFPVNDWTTVRKPAEQPQLPGGAERGWSPPTTCSPTTTSISPRSRRRTTRPT